MSVFVAQLVIDNVAVQVQLADVLGLEFVNFQFEHYEPTKVMMIEEEVQIELVLSGVLVRQNQSVLTPGVIEANAELLERLGEVGDEPGLNVTLGGVRRQCQELEVVGIFD